MICVKLDFVIFSIVYYILYMILRKDVTWQIISTFQAAETALVKVWI